MHVLSLPPAFVLSQDQTLKLKASRDAILDVRTSAHLQYSGPLLGADPYVHPAKDWTRIGSHLFDCASAYQSKQKSVQTVKLTPYNRRYRLRYLSARSSEAPKGVDIQTLIHRNEPNRPHISSVFINVKELHQKAKNKTEAPIP